MEKKLLPLIFVLAAVLNMFVLSSFVTEITTCNSSRVVNSNIMLYLPNSFPGNPVTCGNGSFNWEQLGNNDEWYLLVTVSYGSTILYQKKYGQLPNATGSGIRVYGFSGCVEQVNPSFVQPVDCAYFPVRFKEDYANDITVTLFSPCGYSPNGTRVLTSITQSYGSNTPYASINAFGLWPQNTTSGIVCDPC